jgi:hypothetical protein
MMQKQHQAAVYCAHVKTRSSSCILHVTAPSPPPPGTQTHTHTRVMHPVFAMSYFKDGDAVFNGGCVTHTRLHVHYT